MPGGVGGDQPVRAAPYPIPITTSPESKSGKFQSSPATNGGCYFREGWYLIQWSTLCNSALWCFHWWIGIPNAIRTEGGGRVSGCYCIHSRDVAGSVAAREHVWAFEFSDDEQSIDLEALAARYAASVFWSNSTQPGQGDLFD